MIVTCHGVTRVFGPRRRRIAAVDGCAFEADLGDIVGVVGPNGAGKTTLLRMIAGELPLTTGEIHIAGLRAGTREARRLVGYASDPPSAPPELTGGEWLRYVASHYTSNAVERRAGVQQVVELAELSTFLRRPIRDYSRGMLQRLALAAAQLSGEVVLLLDEVLSGIDPLVVKRLRARLAAMARDGRTIILASHDLATIERLASRVLVMQEGRIAAAVETDALLQGRVLEITLDRTAEGQAEFLLRRFPDASQTSDGIAIPLADGLEPEHVVSMLSGSAIAPERIRCRSRSLEDVLVQTSQEHDHTS